MNRFAPILLIPGLLGLIVVNELMTAYPWLFWTVAAMAGLLIVAAFAALMAKLAGPVLDTGTKLRILRATAPMHASLPTSESTAQVATWEHVIARTAVGEWGKAGATRAEILDQLAQLPQRGGNRTEAGAVVDALAAEAGVTLSVARQMTPREWVILLATHDIAVHEKGRERVLKGNSPRPRERDA